MSCVHCTTMFTAAHRYRAESDRANVANKVSCFPTRMREREREGGRNTSWLFQSCEFTTVTIKRGGLWSTLGPEIVYLSLREKPPFCIPRDPLAVTTCFSLFPLQLVHCHNLLSRLRIVTLLPPSPTHPFQPSAQLPGKFSTEFTHSSNPR